MGLKPRVVNKTLKVGIIMIQFDMVLKPPLGLLTYVNGVKLRQFDMCLRQWSVSPFNKRGAILR